uniref:Uncharacterized protein n=1 Tax=Arundo donax TaxID=35708 RepID=A0A0A9CK43_ARUDO
MGLVQAVLLSIKLCTSCGQAFRDQPDPVILCGVGLHVLGFDGAGSVMPS